MMHGWMRGVVVMGAVAGLSGCYEHTFTTGAGAPTGPVVYSEWHSSWLGGLIGEKNIDVDAVCPSGNATIHDEQSFLNGLVTALTGGIYTPTEVRIRCDTGRDVTIGLDEGDLEVILSSEQFIDRVERMVPGRLEEAQAGVRALQVDRDR